MLQLLPNGVYLLTQPLIGRKTQTERGRWYFLTQDDNVVMLRHIKLSSPGLAEANTELMKTLKESHTTVADLNEPDDWGLGVDRVSNRLTLVVNDDLQEYFLHR